MWEHPVVGVSLSLLPHPLPLPSTDKRLSSIAVISSYCVCAGFGKALGIQNLQIRLPFKVGSKNQKCSQEKSIDNACLLIARARNGL